jgi:hypothetical protein
MTKGTLKVFFGLIVLTLLSPPPGFAQSSEELKALRQEIEVIKEGQRAIRKDLQDIKRLLEKRQPSRPIQPTNVVLSIDKDPFKGEKTAAVTLLDFTDYQ